MGFEKDFLEFDGDDKEKILYSENPNVFINKKYDNVDFSKLNGLEFETNKPVNDLDLLDIDPEPKNTNKLQPTHEQDNESISSDIDSDSKEYSDSGFGDPEEQKYKPFENNNNNDSNKPKKKVTNAESDDFLNY